MTDATSRRLAALAVRAHIQPQASRPAAAAAAAQRYETRGQTHQPDPRNELEQAALSEQANALADLSIRSNKRKQRGELKTDEERKRETRESQQKEREKVLDSLLAIDADFIVAPTVAQPNRLPIETHQSVMLKGRQDMRMIAHPGWTRLFVEDKQYQPFTFQYRQAMAQSYIKIQLSRKGRSWLEGAILVRDDDPENPNAVAAELLIIAIHSDPFPPCPKALYTMVKKVVSVTDPHDKPVTLELPKVKSDQTRSSNERITCTCLLILEYIFLSCSLCFSLFSSILISITCVRTCFPGPRGSVCRRAFSTRLRVSVVTSIGMRESRPFIIGQAIPPTRASRSR